jgi:hypothetical protein
MWPPKREPLEKTYPSERFVTDWVRGMSRWKSIIDVGYLMPAPISRPSRNPKRSGWDPQLWKRRLTLQDAAPEKEPDAIGRGDRLPLRSSASPQCSPAGAGRRVSEGRPTSIPDQRNTRNSCSCARWVAWGSRNASDSRPRAENSPWGKDRTYSSTAKRSPL